MILVMLEHLEVGLPKIFYLFHVCGYTVAVFRHTRRGNRLPITDGCEPPCGFWKLNSGPLEEQLVLLTAEPSLQSVFTLLKYNDILSSVPLMSIL